MRVLVVDDDPTIRDVVTGTLSDERYRVEAVADGSAALAYLERCGQA